MIERTVNSRAVEVLQSRIGCQVDFERLTERYLGETARNYDAIRDGGRKWQREQEALEGLMATLPRGASTLDVPVGTGRLFEFYARHGFNGTGLDVSADMLAEAANKSAQLGLSVDLRRGDIRHIPFPDETFDVVMSIRFLNWIDTEAMRACLTELARVSRCRLLVGIRHLTPFGDLRLSIPDVARLARRLLGHAQARATRSGLVYHEKAAVLATFSDLGLRIESQRVVERRSDGTDYLLYVLSKSSAG